MAPKISQQSPGCVQIIANIVVGGQSAPAKRLLNDPSMKTVWQTLQNQIRKQLKKCGLDEIRRRFSFLDTLVYSWDSMGEDPTKLHDSPMKVLEDYSFEEQACAAFFSHVVFEMAGRKEIDIPRVLSSRAQIIASSTRYREAAKICLEVSDTSYFNEVTSTKLRSAAAALEGYASFNDRFIDPTNPHYSERSGAKSGEEETRALVRSVAEFNIVLFGSPLYGTIFTTVYLGLGKEIPMKNIRNWCRGLRPSLPPQNNKSFRRSG
jgi:hypothetical protein